MTTIIEDTRQKAEKHEIKHRYWESNGIGLVRSALPFGDYITAPKRAVDTKADIHEIAGNMCGNAREKKRFAEECKSAHGAGTKLIFLIEDKNYSNIEDLYGKQIYIHNGMIIPGDQLATAMFTMQGRYNCEFVFCDPKDAGQKIMELLDDNER